MTDEQTGTLSRLVEAFARRAEAGEPVSVGTIQEVSGVRAAGPLLFFPALVVVSPLSLIPTIPSLIGITVVLIAGQLLLGRQSIWLPQRLRRASISADRATAVVDFARPWIARIERLVRPRLTVLADGLGLRLVALLCIIVALTMPPLEFFPGASTTAGTVIATLGLGIMMRDGLLLLAAFALLAGAIAVIASFLV